MAWRDSTACVMVIAVTRGYGNYFCTQYTYNMKQINSKMHSVYYKIKVVPFLEARMILQGPWLYPLQMRGRFSTTLDLGSASGIQKVHMVQYVLCTALLSHPAIRVLCLISRIESPTVESFDRQVQSCLALTMPKENVCRERHLLPWLECTLCIQFWICFYLRGS